MTSLVGTLISKDVKELLHDKYILILGDSVVRGLYKDLITFYNSNDLISEEELRIKGENRFYGDRLVSGGMQKGLTNGIDYEEVREYTGGGRLRIRFYFITRCYSSYMSNVVFNDIKNQTIKPDIIIMNSCVWDISRYGIDAMRSYQRNIDHIMSSFRQMLPDTLFLWLSALPASNSSRGGVIIPSAEYIRPILPGLIRDGNYHCSQLCDFRDVFYVDMHSVFSTMLHLRRADGIHWCAFANRVITETLLNHIKAYYHGVKQFKCAFLRGELENKINTFKERMKKRNPNSTVKYLDQEVSNNDNDSISKSKGKRKRNDDEKENEHCHRKMIIETTAYKNALRTVIIQKSNDESEIKRQKILDNDMIKFDHNYCDIMYDNEYEGLNLLHFSSYDTDSIEESSDLDVLNNINPIKTEQINDSDSELDIKPAQNVLTSMSLSKANEPQYIVLSSDDEDDTSVHIVPSSSTQIVLPIYLLNRL
ncbi:unnamed protein product [Adineta steineri]|uniref:Uncharacterized protein n=1 Tax=Adineta steineri TaxID=433720 RepID=A0A814V2D5_9BILA|nr:unnamed protein product [Adineta steineri]